MYICICNMYLCIYVHICIFIYIYILFICNVYKYVLICPVRMVTFPLNNLMKKQNRILQLLVGKGFEITFFSMASFCRRSYFSTI